MIVSVVSHATNDATCQYLITIFHGFVFFSFEEIGQVRLLRRTN